MWHFCCMFEYLAHVLSCDTVLHISTEQGHRNVHYEIWNCTYGWCSNQAHGCHHKLGFHSILAEYAHKFPAIFNFSSCRGSSATHMSLPANNIDGSQESYHNKSILKNAYPGFQITWFVLFCSVFLWWFIWQCEVSHRTKSLPHDQILTFHLYSLWTLTILEFCPMWTIFHGCWIGCRSVSHLSFPYILVGSWWKMRDISFPITMTALKTVSALTWWPLVQTLEGKLAATTMSNPVVLLIHQSVKTGPLMQVLDIIERVASMTSKI